MSRPVIETSGRLDSRYTGRRMGWTIAVPAWSRPRGIVYCLHAKGANHSMAFDSIGVPEVVRRMNLPLVVAAVDGGKDRYWHRRADGSDALVTPASPALWLTPGATAPGAFDSPADFYANDVFTGVARLRSMSVAVFCGTADPFYTATRHLVSLMRFRHTAHFGPGGHDAAYWRLVAPAQVNMIGRALQLHRRADGNSRDLGFFPFGGHDAPECGQCAATTAQPRGVPR
jgi:hypothetical protein